MSVQGATAVKGAGAEWKAYWPVVLASMFGMSLGSLHFYSIGAFVAPIEREFGWSRAQIVSGVTLVTVVGAIMTPFVGMIIDRIGPRRIAIPGCAVMLAGYAALSQATPSIWTWWLLWAWVAAGAMATKPMIWTVSVASLFDKGRGVALAVVLCGTGIASTSLPILATALIGEFGWRAAFQIIAGIEFAIIFPLLCFGFASATDKRRIASKQAAGKKTDAEALPVLTGVTDAREAFFSLTYAKLMAAAFCFTIAAIGMSVNLLPIMASTGISGGEAAGIAGIVGVTSVVGRLSTGYMLDRLNGRIVGGLCVLLPIITCLILLLSPGSIPMTVVAVIVLGLCLGAELDVMAFLTARYFGTARYGLIFGVITSMWSLASGSGPLLASMVYDRTGAYSIWLWIAIPLFLVASLCLFSLKPPPVFDKEGGNHA